MKILVTGSEGSLMQWVIPHLLGKGHEVIGVDNFTRYGEIERDREYGFIEGDLCDKELVSDVMQGVDAIIQAAARIYGVKGFHKYSADILARDMELQQNLLWAALRESIERFVYISSSMVYERVEKVPTEERHLKSVKIPQTDYGLSKLIGERLCKAFKDQYDLDYTIWRPFNIITPYEKGEDEPGLSHVFADFIRKIIVEKQNPLEIFGDGKQVRCFTWIGDVAKGISDYSFSEEACCDEFNLGNPEPITIKELARNIYDKARSKGIIDSSEELQFNHEPIYEDDVKKRIPSVKKAKEALGWEPKVKLKESLGRCIGEAVKIYNL